VPPAGRARRPRPRPRTSAARYAAPVLFLVAVTIAVLLIRSGLGGGASSQTTTRSGPVTHPSTAKTPPPGTTRQGATTTTAGQFYTVVKGDSFGSISAKTGVSVAQIEQLNPGVSTNSLQVGQKLRLK
jgi:LysM repeat protein